MSEKKEVCIIGAGPAGILAIATLKDCANVSCFERANDIGGQWARGTDEFTRKHYGSRQSSLYSGLWCNAPKEAAVEMPNFTWPTVRPSFIKGDEVKDYILGYAEHFAVREHIQTHTTVDSVVWDDEIEKFIVSVTNVITKEKKTANYDFVCVGTGHFHYPNDPVWEGQETFPGTLIHSHDFSGQKYVGQRVLCTGGSYSAEDICLLCHKNGAKISHVSSRRPFGYTDWPSGVENKPILTSISGSTVTFSDGTTEDYDVIINCTGFVPKFPFLSAQLQPGMEGNKFVPNGLYKQCISVANERLFFFGMQCLAYTNTLFQLQTYLVRDVILGKIAVPNKAERQRGLEADLALEAAFTSVFDAIKFQTNYLNHLSAITDEPCVDTEHIWVGWVKDKLKSIMNFRKNNYASIHTKAKAEESEYC